MRRISLISCIVLMALVQKSCTQPRGIENIDALMGQLTEAMINKEITVLEELLSDQLVYGHSNGKVQNKNEFMAEIASGLPIRYLEISRNDEIIQLSGDVAIVRHVFAARTLADDLEGNLQIGNMLIWSKEGGRWKLLARQAYRL